MTIMPGESEQSIMIRTIRRILMQLLNHSYPSKQLVETLFRNSVYIEPTYEKGSFIKDVFYLQEKGYVVVTEPLYEKGCNLLKRYIKLTATGKEIAERTMVDLALEI